MLKKFFKKTEVKKNLLISTTGIAIGQMIHLGTTPIISRLYTPDQFGLFSLFLSFLGIFTAVSLCKFDLALLTAEGDEVGSFKRVLSKLSLFTTLAVLIILIFLLLKKSPYWEVFALLLLAVPVSNKFWTHRAIVNKVPDFKKLGIGKVFENITNGLVTIGMAFTSLKSLGLFSGKIASLCVTYVFFRSLSSKKFKSKTSLTTKEVIVKYSNFPKYSFPAELVAQLNLNATIFIFSYLFSTVEVGLIGLATRVMSIPANFVSVSFYDVYKQKALHDFKHNGEFKTIFRKFFLVLLTLAASMILTIYFLGPDLFDLVFGSKWLKAGVYAQYLCFLYAFHLISNPLAFSLEIVNKHHLNLLFQLAYLVVGILAVFITYKTTGNDISCIQAYSLSLAGLYALNVLVAYLNSGK